MDSSVSAKDEIWFLRVCHHISNAVYRILAVRDQSPPATLANVFAHRVYGRPVLTFPILTSQLDTVCVHLRVNTALGSSETKFMCNYKKKSFNFHTRAKMRVKRKGKGRLWVLQHCCLEAYCTLTRMSSFIHLQRRCTHQAA